MKDKIWLSSPHMGTSEQKYVQEAFETNWIAPLGPHVNGLEQDLQKYTGVAHAAVLSSGTAALHLALIEVGVGRGDYVLCQSFTFCGSSNPIAYIGAHAVFVDSETETWNLDPKIVEAVLTVAQNPALAAKHPQIPVLPQVPKAVIAVDLYGVPAQLETLKEICARFNVALIEDAAEALGASHRGVACGAWGDLGVLSFNGNKIITTSGGGALISNRREYIDRARFLATQARDEAPHYQHSTIGYNYRMSNVCAAIGRGQMEVLDERVQARRANFKKYEDYFAKWNSKGFAIQFQPQLEGDLANRWLSCIWLDPAENKGISRETIREGLAADNIEARPLWKPMHMQPVHEGAQLVTNEPVGALPICEKLFANGLCLPSGSNLTDVDFKRIFEVLDGIFESA
jgi:dTDP-4-amino-4,6-dideoxygalactose transaminase